MTVKKEIFLRVDKSWACYLYIFLSGGKMAIYEFLFVTDFVHVEGGKCFVGVS